MRSGLLYKVEVKVILPRHSESRPTTEWVKINDCDVIVNEHIKGNELRRTGMRLETFCSVEHSVS